MSVDTTHDVLVMGAGIAGLSAAGACARAGLRTIIAGTGLFGGLVLNVNELTDPPRPDAPSGADYAAALFDEAMEAGAEPVDGHILALHRDGTGFAAEREDQPGESLRARVVICATGATLRRLPVPGADAFEHRGLANCADCDGPMLKGKAVMVVGGGDSALQGALTLARWAAEVHLVLRGATPRARPDFVARVAAEPRIRILPHTSVIALHGDRGLEAVELRDAVGVTRRMAVAALFPWIGLEPCTAALPPDLARDAGGAVMVDDALRSSVPGLFAAGAVRSGQGGTLSHAVADGEAAARGAIALLR
jgi:thioredoxin reductase (NADPH)